MLFTLHNIDKNKLEKENIVNVGLLLFQWHKFVKINRNIKKNSEKTLYQDFVVALSLNSYNPRETHLYRPSKTETASGAQTISGEK